MVGNARHVAVEGGERDGCVAEIARRGHRSQRPPQALEDELIHKAAAIVYKQSLEYELYLVSLELVFSLSLTSFF